MVKHSERRIRGWLVDYPRAVPVGIFLLLAAITTLSVFAIERGEGQREEAQLREIAQSVASTLERRANASSASLRAGAALFSTLDQVDEPIFRRFVEELRFDSDYRGADGIGWAQLVRPQEIPQFEREVLSQLPGEIRVHPDPPAGEDRLVPVTYLLPDTERNRRALGYDMYSQPTRRAAMDEAESLVRPTATGRVVLLQEGRGSTPGFLVYMPVYQDGPRGRQLRGFIFSPFNGQDFLSSAVERARIGGSSIRLYDAALEEDTMLAQVGSFAAEGAVVTEMLSVANRPMILAVESGRGTGLSQLSMITLLFGLLVASLLMVVARLITQQAIEDRASLRFLEEQNSIRASLTRELNHRVKNTLANVLSIVSLTRRRADTLDDFADNLEGRIRALSATHDLLTQSEWGTTPIRAVVTAELAPYALDSERSLTIAGPDVELAPNDALSLGLAIHELATNAAKYGALSQPGGKVVVTWSIENPELARVEWIETGGPPVPPTRKRGFGTDLIEKIVAHELRNPVKLDFGAGGVTCTLLVPIREPTEFQLRARNRMRPREEGRAPPQRMD